MILDDTDAPRSRLIGTLWAVELPPFGVRVDCEVCGPGVFDQGDGVEHSCGTPPVWVTKVDDN